MTASEHADMIRETLALLPATQTQADALQAVRTLEAELAEARRDWQQYVHEVKDEQARADAAEAENARLKAALEPFTRWDFHASQWIRLLGHGLRAIPAEDIDKLMKQVEDAKAALASVSEGDTTCSEHTPMTEQESPFAFFAEVMWTTPKFGFRRFGHVIEQRDDLVRVDFGEGEVRSLPADQLRLGWSPENPSGVASGSEGDTA